ncbi:MAG TPA: VTT domain-containing protein [Flavipsychrobacter sp.]
MNELLALFHNLTNPDWIIQHGGLYIILFIVFAETGLFIGFFLPGDTLLFIAGMLIANAVMPDSAPLFSLLYWTFLISLAGILGNYLGYWFGNKFGDMLQHKDSRLFRRKYLMQAHDFYEKKGGSAIVLARFLPIVRTFAPIVAGMVKMDKRKFSWYNILGSFIWVGSITGAGFLLGENAWVKDNLEKIVIGIVVVTTTPVIIKFISGRKKKVIDPV